MLLDMVESLPVWVQDWLGVIVPASQVVLIIVVAWVLQRLVRRVIRRLKELYSLPTAMLVGGRRITGFLIYGAALLLILDRLGVSGTVLWTAFTGFAAVAAVAFFAAWSVLSNIFCTILIFATRPFRIDDYIEVVENGEKAGLRGRVIDINLIYTTLLEPLPGEQEASTVLQVPNNLFFQRVVRRWRGRALPIPE